MMDLIWNGVGNKGASELEMIDRFQRFRLPRTVDEAVDVLISDLTTQQMAAMGKMNDAAFDHLCEQLVPYLQDDFRLWSGNDELLSDCFENAQCQTETDPMRIILKHMRLRLQEVVGVYISL